MNEQLVLTPSAPERPAAHHAAPVAPRSTGRDVTLDVFRGLLIALVVVGHTNSPFNLLIYSFHMPAWFIISGLLHRERPARELVTSRLATLMVPYWAANVLLWGVLYGLNYKHLNTMFIYPNKAVTVDWLTRVFTQCSYSVGMLGASWFLPVLFGVSLLAAGMIALQRRLGLSNAALALASIGLMACGVKLGYTIYYLDLFLFCQFFYIMGYLVRQEGLRPDRTKMAILGVAAAVILSFQYFFYNQFFNVIGRKYNSVALLVLFSACGTWLVYLAARTIFRHIPLLGGALAYAGRKSVHILLFHFIGFKIWEMILVYAGGYPKTFLTMFPGPPRTEYPHWYLTALFAIVFSLAVGWAVERVYRIAMDLIFGKNVTMKSLIDDTLFKKSVA